MNPRLKQFLVSSGSFLLASLLGVGLAGAGFVTYTGVQNYFAEKRQTEEQAAALLISQEKSLQETRQELASLKERATNAETRAAAIEQKLTDEKAALEKKIQAAGKAQGLVDNNRVSSAVQSWRPRVVRVSCVWRNGSSAGTSSASGLLTKDPDGPLIVLTNRHVIMRSTENADSCTISFPSKATPITVDNTGSNFKISILGLDWGVITIPSSNAYASALAKTPLTKEACKENPTVGDQVVILGYPTIGSQDDITATEGIVSGFEENFFITSAKIERGNSGGAAILIKNSCYLGAPTFVESGGIESLARILDARTIFSKP